ncbi:MAG: DUF937 domain-containing protein [Actinomycetia bacterium]|nr:DUF937 domain-containing protein [Actinomycetes bacterium]
MSTTVVDEILERVRVDELAEQLGVSLQEAERAARAAVLTLIGGLQHNASDAEQEPAIAGALLEHQTSSLLQGGLSLADVDTDDGEKIVLHIFGDQIAPLAQALGSGTGSSQDLIRRLLRFLAPVVLAYLAQRISTGLQSPGGSDQGILGDIRAGELGGQAQQPAGPGGGAVLGSVLGSILSGGSLGPVLGGQAPQPAPQPQQQAQPAPQPQTPQQQAQPPGGGIVDDILGGLFGNR